MSKHNSRRNFIIKSSLGLIAAPALANISFNVSKTFSQTESVLNNPKLKLNVKDYGASGDGITIETNFIQKTIDRCAVLGGGEVIFPSGKYRTGAFQLHSNITLKIEKDAEIIGTPEFKDYPITQVRWEGKWAEGHTGLIYASDSENIGIYGEGKINGNYALGGRPTKEYPFRHPALIEFINCKNITIEGISTDYSLMWSIHPTYCENLTFKNLNIRSVGGNGDGIDIDSCKNVTIDNCDIATGDDCIAIKSGRGMEGYTINRPTENVTIRNCKLSDSIFACIGIGSETSGGIRNITIENCTFTNTKTHAIYIKSRPGRGAFIENIIANNLDVSGMEGGFLRLNILRSGIQDEFPVPGIDGIPTIKNFKFSNIRVKNVKTLVDGTSIHPSKPLDCFELTNVSGSCEEGISLANMEKVILKNYQPECINKPFLKIYHVKGEGIEEAVSIEFPHKIENEISQPQIQYQLK